MSVTLFGIAVIMIAGWLLLRASTLAMLEMVMLAGLLGGSSAINLANGSSILPGVFAVLFLAARALVPAPRPPGTIRAALDANLPLLLFTAYGVMGALILPFIFAGVIEVAPLRPIFVPNPFAKAPLAFTPQNLTSAGYLITTMLAAVGACVAVQRVDASRRVARAGSVIALSHAALGFASIALSDTPLAAFFRFFRNALYNQLDQDVAGLSRMSGIFAEPSNYAGFGFIYFVFVTELWLRDVDRRWSGPAALVLLAALIVSTSTTAYIGIAGYAVILLMRQILFPHTVAGPKLVALILLGLTVAAGFTALIVLRPEVLKLIDTIYRLMVANKAESESGQVRMMWARQGLEAFSASFGLGVGVGSFRSSSLATAILGSMGVIGIATYGLQMLRVLQPLRRSTYVRSGHLDTDVGAAAAWTVIVMSVPAYLSAPSPDPGLTWGLMAGIALGLRNVARASAGAAQARGMAGRAAAAT